MLRYQAPITADAVAAVLALSDIAYVEVVPGTSYNYGGYEPLVETVVSDSWITVQTVTVVSSSGYDSFVPRVEYRHVDRYATNASYEMRVLINSVQSGTTGLYQDSNYPSMNTSYINLTDSISVGDVLEVQVKKSTSGSMTVQVDHVRLYGDISISLVPNTDFVFEVS